MDQAQKRGPVVFAGENPLIILYRAGSDDFVAVASLWHCTYSDAGDGYSLILWVDPSALEHPDPASTGIYTDNTALARMLWSTLNRRWEPLQNRGFETTELQTARFVQMADGRRLHRTLCTSGATTIELVWHDITDVFYTVTFPYEYEVSSVIAPCTQASIIVNGQKVIGEVRPHEDVFQSSAILAFCETWVARGQGV